MTRGPVEHLSPRASPAGVVPEPEDQMAEETRGGNGHGQEEARLGDGEDEGELGQRGRRRVQQAPGPQLGRREDHETVEKAQGHQPGADQPVQQQLGHLVMVGPPAWGARGAGAGGVRKDK